MNKKLYFLSGVLVMICIVSCRKSPDYVPVPYACACGNLKWQSTDYQLLDANYILLDSTVAGSRRYYVTANVALDGEVQTHSINTWIEIPDVESSSPFQIDEDQGLDELSAWVDEFNLNDPIDTVRQYIPVEAVVSVSPAGPSGGNESVSFYFLLNEVVDGVPINIPVTYEGSFNVNIND